MCDFDPMSAAPALETFDPHAPLTGTPNIVSMAATESHDMLHERGQLQPPGG